MVERKDYMINYKTKLWELYYDEEDNTQCIAPKWAEDWDEWDRVKALDFKTFWKEYKQEIEWYNEDYCHIPKYKWLILGWIQLQCIKMSMKISI